MYLPFGSATLLRFLQLPALLPNFDQPERLEEHYHRKDLNHLGNISPYHNAPAVPGVSADLPEDCTVDQVILVSFRPDNKPVSGLTLSTIVASSWLPWSCGGAKIYP